MRARVILAKDFVETAEGLMFAVVASGVEQGKVLCFLRYIKTATGWEKLATEQANAFLARHHPDYLHYSPLLDAQLHAVALARIVHHYPAQQRLQQLLQDRPEETVTADLSALCQLLQGQGIDVSQLGVTGSILVGVQKHSSDIDLLCYERGLFQHCRAAIRALLAAGLLQDLHEQDWHESYQRRACALSFEDYVWHERRKGNKALVQGRKFDLSWVDARVSAPIQYQKCGFATVQCQVLDDTYAFDYPSLLVIDHAQYATVVSFTATYAGQAVTGETVEISGQVEQDPSGRQRLLVGSSREATGEYIKVIRV